ncbi:MFS transporter [Bacillus sp. C1]
MSNLQFKFKLQTTNENWRCPHEIVASNEREAKYKYFHTFRRGFFEARFEEFIKQVECENLGIFDVTPTFKEEEQFERMRNKRKILFAYIGMKVQILGRMGTIIGNCKSNLLVVFDGNAEIYNCDPRFEIAYFDKNGRIIKDTRKGVYAV